MKRAVCVIPARFKSTRFPGKPLALIGGQPMIRRVYEAALKAQSVSGVFVATDDKRIADACRSFGAPVIMTSPAHRTGTERVAEAARSLDAEVIINVQGDEPLLRRSMIDGLVDAFRDPAVRMASLMARVYDLDLIRDRNRVKVVVDKDDFALYFSRSPLPCEPRDFFFQHVGLYGFARDFLFEFASWAPSRLEEAESLEQLRALENGARIRMVETPFIPLSVDSPGDIIEVERTIAREGHD